MQPDSDGEWRRRLARRVVRRCCAALSLLALLAPLRAEELLSREAELEAIRDEIGRLQAELGRVQQRETGLTGELARTGAELRLQEQRVAEAELAHTLAEERVTSTGLEVARLEQRLVVVRDELRSRLLGLYRLGHDGYLRLLFALRPGEGMLSGIRLLRFLARRDAEAMNLWVDARARLAVERDQLEADRQARTAWLGRERQRREQLDALRRRQTQLLADARRQGLALAERATALAEKEHKLSNFLDFLYGRAAETLSGKPMPSFRGALDWPVSGRVTAGFGPRLDPRYGTRVPHNGLDIACVPGSEVRVVYPGRVAFAAAFEGYGPTVVVEHAGRVFTLYAGLARVLVAQGDVLSLRGVVGTAADSLYFEIRAENRPEDPRLWLR